MTALDRNMRRWRRKWATKIESINSRLDASERAAWIWNDELTLEWRAKLDAGERGRSE